MNLFFFFLWICDRKDNHVCMWHCSASACVWQSSQILLPMDSQKCLGENEKQSLICVFVRLPSIVFKLEYLQTDGMMAERYFCILSCFFLFMKWECHVSLCFHVDFLWMTFRVFAKVFFSGLVKTVSKSHSSLILCCWYQARNKASASDYFITGFLLSKTGMFAFIPYFRN